MKYTFSFREVNYGSVAIDSDHTPDISEVIDAIMNGNAYIKDTEYEDIRLDETAKAQPTRDRPHER